MYVTNQFQNYEYFLLLASCLSLLALFYPACRQAGAVE